MTKGVTLLAAITVLLFYAAPFSYAAIIATQADDSVAATLDFASDPFDFVSPYQQKYTYYIGNGFSGDLDKLTVRMDGKGNTWLLKLYCRLGSDFFSTPCSSFGGNDGITMTGGTTGHDGTYKLAPADVTADYTATWSGTNTFEPVNNYYFSLFFDGTNLDYSFSTSSIIRGSKTSSYQGECVVGDSTPNFCDQLPDIYFILNTVTIVPTPVLTAVSVASNNASSGLAKAGNTVTITFASSVELGAASSTIAGKMATVATTSPTVYTASYQLAADDTEGPINFTLSYSNLQGGAGFTTSTTTDSSAVTFDRTAPVLAENGAIAASTNTTPSYSFTSSEAGTLAFSGACRAATSTVGVGTTTLTFAALAVGTYNSCSLSVTDAAGNTGVLSISPFTIQAPTPAPAASPSSGGGGGGGGNGIPEGPFSVGYQIPYTPPQVSAPAPSAPEPTQITVGAPTGSQAHAPKSEPKKVASNPPVLLPIAAVAEPVAQIQPTVKTPWDTPAGKQINLAAAAATSGLQLPSWILILVALLLAILGSIAWNLPRRT